MDAPNYLWIIPSLLESLDMFIHSELRTFSTCEILITDEHISLKTSAEISLVKQHHVPRRSTHQQARNENQIRNVDQEGEEEFIST